MRHALTLALAYLRFHRLTSGALITCIALIVTVPVATRLILNAAQQSLGDRARQTPLLMGARGSTLDLTLAALYFDGAVPGEVTQGAVDAVWDSGLGLAIPLHLGLTARQVPLVGTTLDYLDYRGLALAQGRPLAQIGEAVLGASAARRLGLDPGDTVVTDARTLFDLEGVYPLELTVAGVLAPSRSADDDAVFVDMNTVWIIAGIGHGHTEPVASQNGLPVVASPAIRQFNRITPDNIASFHVHANPAALPVSAVIVVPNDDRAAAILQGRYLEASDPLQLIAPLAVIDRLLGTLLRIGRLLDLVVVIVGAATLIAVALALTLATRLRATEMATLFRLGAHRLTIARIIGAQIGVILILGLGLAATFLIPVAWLSSTIADLMLSTGL